MQVKPSTNLTWKPCFDDFTCSRLEVPLNYANATQGTTSIAFIKLSGKNATVDSPSILVVPGQHAISLFTLMDAWTDMRLGGPGGSGVELLFEYKDLAAQMFGEQYNIVSFDPRGVNNSGPTLDCFSGNKEARSAFNRLHDRGMTNLSSVALTEQYYSAAVYGEWCNNAVETESPHGYYVTTPAVARDLLAFTEAEAMQAGQSPRDAKLWMYAVSYGTVVGTTFASMFPDRVGRMVLDGVMNADQYYDNDWRDTISQADEAIATFSSFCHDAGPDKCAFWGPTPADIAGRMDNLIQQLQDQPVPVSGISSGALPALVTSSDLKAVFIVAVTNPLASFPTLADILHQLESGNASALVGQFDGLMESATDAGRVIRCADSYRRNKVKTMEQFTSYAEHTASQSKYIGDIFPVYVDTILCRAMQPQLPDDMVVQGKQCLNWKP